MGETRGSAGKPADVEAEIEALRAELVRKLCRLLEHELLPAEFKERLAPYLAPDRGPSEEGAA